MEIITQKNEKYVVFQPIGKIDSVSSHELEKVLCEGLMENISQNIVVDFKSVSYISSAGLRVILILAKKIKAQDGKFMLCGMNDVVKNVFDISGFSSIIEIYNAIDDIEQKIKD